MFYLNSNTYIFNKSLHTTLIKKTSCNVLKRFMQRCVGTGTHLMHPTLYPRISSRYYPGKYKVSRIRPTLTDNERQRFGITEHEAKHMNIIDQKTNNVEGIFTSAQNKDNNAAGGTFCKVAPVKVNGTYTPQINPVTKKLVLDTDNNTVPDPNKGGQWMAILERPRKVSQDAKYLYETHKDAQTYIDKHEDIIKSHIENSRARCHPKLPKQIGGQDNEPLP